MQPDPGFIAGMQLLGRRIRAMRGRMSQTRLAAEVGSSRSEISRVERGEKLLGPALADSLDRYFGTGGDVRAERDALELGAHTSLTVGQFRERWLHHFPASYVGAVWTRVTPHPRRTQRAHSVRISWGPWDKDVYFDSLPPIGRALAYTKGDDGLSIPLFFVITPAAALEHGLGEIPDAMDINAGWIRSSRP